MKKNTQTISLSPFIRIAQIENGNGLKELSGQTPTDKRGEFWGINDKGNDPEIFRFSINGSVLQQVEIKKIKNDDWEAIAQHPDGSLLIGGVGDNDRKKDEYYIHQIEAPKRTDEKIKTVESYEFVYSDKRRHNCEAMFVFNSKVYLITKEENEHQHSKIYRLDTLRSGRKLTAKVVTNLTEPGIVTDAAYDQTKKLLAVLTYNQIMLFRVTNERDLFNAPMFRMAIDLKQCEGVCFYGDEILVSNEEGELWAAKIEQG
ncbi:MAG: SdiA-regulated domain-containing protein [Candidatus Hinthialibacter antarcticus]|nr:SdiA-regulated domain-containing protein [Candidatus Hinthialibacter antarcticus]